MPTRNSLAVAFLMCSITCGAQSVRLLPTDYALSIDPWRTENSTRVFSCFKKAVDDSEKWEIFVTDTPPYQQHSDDFIKKYYETSYEEFKFDFDEFIASAFSNESSLITHLPKLNGDQIEWQTSEVALDDYIVKARDLMRSDARYIGVFVAHPCRRVAEVAAGMIQSEGSMEYEYDKVFTFITDFGLYNAFIVLDLIGSGSSYIRFVLSHAETSDEAEDIVDYFVLHHTSSRKYAIIDYSMISINTSKYLQYKYHANENVGEFGREILSEISQRSEDWR
jgi:hypothetical protein